MKRKYLWFAIPLLVLLLIPGSWLLWFHTRPVYDEDKWSKMTSNSPEFILYLFDATSPNAARALRDGLMNELVRSGALSPGYPKLRSVLWETDPRCRDENLVATGRYFIQLSETPDNYIELPLCPRIGGIGYSLIIHILPAWPWSQVDFHTPQIFIGMSRSGDPEKQYLLKPGQRELILKSLENMGVKLYLDEYFHYDSNYGK